MMAKVYRPMQGVQTDPLPGSIPPGPLTLLGKMHNGNNYADRTRRGNDRETRPEVNPAAGRDNPVRGSELRRQKCIQMAGRWTGLLRRRVPARGDGGPSRPALTHRQVVRSASVISHEYR